MGKLQHEREFGRLEDRLLESSRVAALAAIAKAMSTAQPDAPDPPRSLLWIGIAAAAAVMLAAALLVLR